MRGTVSVLEHPGTRVIQPTSAAVRAGEDR